jgi:hypothetical protein
MTTYTNSTNLVKFNKSRKFTSDEITQPKQKDKKSWKNKNRNIISAED